MKFHSWTSVVGNINLLIRKSYRNSCPILYVSRFKSGVKQWEKDLTADVKLDIEKYWKSDVLEQPMGKDGNNLCYILSMFPYPSGQLHMGHVRVYSLSDTISRFHRLNGKKVIHPMGWDAFGLPAENAAFERNNHPQRWTSSNISAMKTQLLDLGFKFDWNREITTCMPNYYKWTQFIFLKLLENGLAYQTKAVVNWDPVDQTVLADEQVDDNGCSWRSGAQVEKKLLMQWYIKTTQFAKQLYDGLGNEDLVDWKDIINLQKHWIGECNGILVKFSLKSEEGILDALEIWSENLEKIIHGQFITVKPGSILCNSGKYVNTDKIPAVAVNPINGKELPIIVAENVEYPEGRDVYIASPQVCTTDYNLTNQLGLNATLTTNYEKYSDEQKEKIIQNLKIKNVGVHPVSSKLRDWLISRQRYWGTPIPIIHCKSCGAVPVPYEDLPVELPEVKSITLGLSPLSEDKDWLNCACPKCGSSALRETDTMDTFVDSSWYFLRFLDSTNNKKPFDIDVVNSCFPVDLYIGGKEHAVLHLYYARFITHFLNSIKWVSKAEPFKKLLVQGMVMGKSYRLKSSGKYLPLEKVKFENKKAFHMESGEVVEVQWEKMSKSKYNGENPQDLLEKYGCDTTRLFMLADVTPATHRHWSDATFPGVLKWQHRLWITIKELHKHRENESLVTLESDDFKKHEEDLWKARNYFTVQSTYHYRHTHHLSIVISRLQALTNSLRKVPPEVTAKSREFELALSSLIIMLAPIAPHFCCELWAGLQSAPNRINTDHSSINWNGNVLEQSWPVVDDNYHLVFVCKVDGAVRSQLKMLPKELANMTKDEAVRMMLNEKQVVKCVKKGISKVVFENHANCGATLNIFTIQTHTKNEKESEKVSLNN